MTQTGQGPLLSLSGISKRYGGVRALEKVDFSCRAGAVHAILGENGAGKSTLIKIISGVVRPDEGSLSLDGRNVQFTGPLDANRAGIVCVFQELSLLPDLSVADNIAIAEPPRRFGLIDRRAQRRLCEELLARVGCEDVNPAQRISDLPLSRRQMVEIAKALGKRPRLLILDEATSALTASDVTKVYALLRQLRKDGVALLYISHRMHEIEELADDCSVFRNGRHVATFRQGEQSPDQVVQMMIGRDIAHAYPPKPPPRPMPAALQITGLSWEGRLKNISLEVGKGEIVGLGGLDGQGQRELLLALFGVLSGLEGSIRIDGQPYVPRNPSAAKDPSVAMALIPEDRKTEGLMLPMTIAENLTMASLDALSRGAFIDEAGERKAIDEAIAKLRIKIGDPGDPVATLSGGNQQKVVIGKWLMTRPRIILLNDPTRGIDVGTKQEIYQLLRHLADEGAAILLYSTDYDELIGCCDRVYILYDGAVVRELAGDAITEKAIVASSLNITTAEAA